MNAGASFATLGAPSRSVRIPPWWSWPIAAVVIAALGLTGTIFTPPGGSAAAWWPAAGAAALFALLNPPRRRGAVVLLVLVVTVIPNLMYGRSLAVAVGYALANAMEIAALLAVLAIWGYRGSRTFVLRRTREALVLVVAGVTGALVAALIAAVTVALLGDGDFSATALSVFPSHAAAVLLIAPFACIPPSSGPVPLQRWEAVLQPALLVGVLAFVAFPRGEIPLTFLPFMIIAWGCLRLPFAVSLIEVLVAGIAILMVTLAGRGPFALGLSAAERAITVEIFLIALATVSLLLLTARAEQQETARAAARTSHLLSGGLVETEVGLAVARRDGESTRLLWANPAARSMIALELDGDQWKGPLEHVARHASRDGVERVHTEGDISLRLVANPIENDPGLFAVQVLDVSSTVRMVQAHAEAERERAAATELRADLSRQRDDFISTTSHELRTPLTSVLGYAELLEESPVLTALERDWVARIRRNGLRLSDLVEDLLMVGGAHATPVSPGEQHTLSTRSVVAAIVASHGAAADEKGLRLEIDVDAGTNVHGVPADIHRSLGALLTNAILFTPADGDVLVRVREDGDVTEISVSDSGPGMSDADRDRAFDRFFRTAEAEHSGTPGVGLGLSIAQRLAQRNGGTLELVSPASGGLRAVLRLPAAPHPT